VWTEQKIQSHEFPGLSRIKKVHCRGPDAALNTQLKYATSSETHIIHKQVEHFRQQTNENCLCANGSIAFRHDFDILYTGGWLQRPIFPYCLLPDCIGSLTCVLLSSHLWQLHRLSHLPTRPREPWQYDAIYYLVQIVNLILSYHGQCTENVNTLETFLLGVVTICKTPSCPVRTVLKLFRVT